LKNLKLLFSESPSTKRKGSSWRIWRRRGGKIRRRIVKC